MAKTIDEIMDWAKEEVDKFAIYFYADDLKFFQRSGRVSNFKAIVGDFFGIKPIINIFHTLSSLNLYNKALSIKAPNPYAALKGPITTAE